ncbi:hypothetical protein LJR013_003439 [Pseudarthrobacter oxydans]|uniref:hypothetical protein n=1 Tax=Pseudarthrobacter oxydans TaxID=1671 RepID=UPI0015749BEE|nr:hypothetical protein [Pseudarthrobacter oxydans]MDV2982506.1 hypothetical protein [Actinomycetes bacterium ARC8]NSX38957.1 hypothetical protein [Pseudarthrobacter oxydans]
MTENQWPQTPGTATTDPYGVTAAGAEENYGTTPAGGSAGTSKSQAAKEEASNVAGQAATSAQNVAQSAKDEAAHVASEAKHSAQDLLHQAKSGLTSQAGTQQQKAAEGIRTISSQLHSMADAPDQQGMASDLIRQAAGTTDTVASWLENKQPGDILGEVQRFARNNPGTFLLLAAGAGVLAGRLTRGLTAGAPESRGAAYGSPSQPSVQNQPVAPLHQETGYAAGNDDLYSEPVVGAGAPVSTTSLPSGTAEETPLRFEDDPYRDEDGSYRSTDGGYRSSEGRQL